MKNLTPLQAIRKKCLWCMGGNAKQVSECHLKDCPFFYYRFGRKEIPGDGIELKSTMKSIRAFCLECSTFNVTEVRNCEIDTCPVHKFRLGSFSACFVVFCPRFSSANPLMQPTGICGLIKILESV